MPLHTSTLLLPLQAKNKELNNKALLSVEYGIWINSMQWDYYCTFTTRYQLTMPAARRTIQRLHQNLSNQYIEKPVIFWCAEPFDTKYGCHIHALIKVQNKTDKTIKHLKDTWQKVSKGKGLKEYNNTTIKIYDPLLGGNYYVAKYLFQSNADYDIFS